MTDIFCYLTMYFVHMLKVDDLNDSDQVITRKYLHNLKLFYSVIFSGYSIRQGIISNKLANREPLFLLLNIIIYKIAILFRLGTISENFSKSRDRWFSIPGQWIFSLVF